MDACGVLFLLLVLSVLSWNMRLTDNWYGRSDYSKLFNIQTSDNFQ